MLLVTVLCIGFSATSIQAATPRTILTLEVWGKCTIEQGQFDSCNNG